MTLKMCEIKVNKWCSIVGLYTQSTLASTHNSFMLAASNVSNGVMAGGVMRVIADICFTL